MTHGLVGRGVFEGADQDLAQSSGSNLIGNLWNVFKKKIDGHKTSTKSELLKLLHQKRRKKRRKSPNINVKDWRKVCKEK